MSGNPLNFHFVGIISSYIPYRDIAISQQTGTARIVFEENTGLTQVLSCDLIREIGKMAECQEQAERVYKEFGKK